MKKIVFSDIDRTLTVSNVVSLKNKEMIKKYIDLGNYFVLVSGRVIPYASSISKQIGASGYVICTNGAVVYDYNSKKVIYGEIISFDIVNRLYNLANEYDARIIFGGIKTTYANKLKYPENETLIHSMTNEIYDNNPITQITISHPDKEVTKKIIKDVEKLPEIKILNRHRSLYDETFNDNGNIWIDIASKNVDKGKAIIKLLEYLNIDLKDSVRIGDDLNDLSMFLDKGLNVAVENAISDLKEKADYITKTCDSDGVAYALEKIIAEEI